MLQAGIAGKGGVRKAVVVPMIGLCLIFGVCQAMTWQRPSVNNVEPDAKSSSSCGISIKTWRPGPVNCSASLRD